MSDVKLDSVPEDEERHREEKSAEKETSRKSGPGATRKADDVPVQNPPEPMSKVPSRG